MEDYQTALYGLFVIIAIGIVQFLINQFMLRKSQLEKEKIDNILFEISKVNSKLDVLVSGQNRHETEIEILKEKILALQDRMKANEDKCASANDRMKGIEVEILNLKR